MIALDGISSLILGTVFEDNSMFRPALRQISWGIIWFTYIQKSLGYFGIINFVKIYRNLIEQSEEKYYNPLENLKLLK